MNTTLYLDIETIPSQKAGVLDDIRANITAPAKLSKPESIAAWLAGPEKEAAAQEAYRKTALNGTMGEVVCIGWAINDGPVNFFCRALGGSESKMLQDFFAAVNSATSSAPLWVGHNIIGFDLRFLYQRAVINSVNPLMSLPHDTRYNGKEVYDTMLAWAGWGNRVSLKNLCAALDVPVKEGDIDGSKVWDYVQAGKILEVAEYCRHDVEATREAYHRMTFDAHRSR